jgi:hypothetical protein
MNQVHKETLNQVENALPNRQGLEVEIFGMEGIPQDVLEQHRNRIIQNFYQAQEDRRIATGNPTPGQGAKNPRKKVKTETADELKKRLAEHRANVAAQKQAGANGGATNAPTSSSPGSFVSVVHNSPILTSTLALMCSYPQIDHPLCSSRRWPTIQPNWLPACCS